MSPLKIENPCVLCGCESSLMCQRCLEPYCNAICQRKDWQKHKYYCTPMPSLVKLNGEVKKPIAEEQSLSKPNSIKKRESDVPNPTVDSKDIKSLSENAEKPLSKAWRDPFLPPGDDFFEARVTFMEKEGPFWVVAATHVESLERLMDNMMKAMNSQKLKRAELVEVDTLVAIEMDNKIHRGNVLTVDEMGKRAEIRMIDNGAVVTIQFKDIYSALFRMSDVKAFAFRVKQPTTTGVQTNKNLTLRFVSHKTSEGLYNVQMKPKLTIPLNLPIELLKVNPELNIVRVFKNDFARSEPESILVQLKVLDNINQDLNEILTKRAQPCNGPFPDEKCTFFVAARTKDGFRRVFLLDHLEFPTPTFLVYEMDEGKISLCNEVCRIPSQLLGLPMRVFSIMPNEPIYKGLKEDGCGDEQLSVKFKQDIPASKDKIRTLNASLLANGKPIGLVRLNSFLGQVSDLGHKFWRNAIKNEDLVYITHVVNYSEVYISSKDTLRYANIFNRLESKCKPFKETTDIPEGCIVLVTCPILGIFRGEILNVKNGMFTVENVDTGSSHTVHLKALRMACRFLENLPVSLMRVKLKTVRDIPEAAVPVNSGAIRLLNEHSAQQDIFSLDMPISNLAVDLLSRSSDQTSLVGRILPIMFTSANPPDAPPTPAKPTAQPSSVAPQPVLLEPARALPPLPPSPPGSPDRLYSVDARQLLELSTASVLETKPFERYYYADLVKHLVPVGEDIEVICLGACNMSKTGYITACFFQNEKVAENFQGLLSLVAHHGTCAHNSVTTYLPGVGELCLAIYSLDNCWYRGVCLENDHKTTKILYCDFGNVEHVPSENLKPIPNDALHPVYATKCYIDGFDKTKDFTALEEYLSHPIKLKCRVRNGPETDSRIITIPNMDKILAQVEV
ncbi:uncharacterized protein Dana_GF18797, isoform B [Drosophila ananassae]|uniref:Uncharacterized protein, isoform A n=1 Tax=Drosophila ananassae TaxID=7217 RepID=B3LYT3_DROAN|nr:tudor domain-containing protein 1 [Drosophila ananassae]EDV44049.2 uncharacterized protein Dana_GF18797, isoform A [Drosophila ananassae]KPU80596.1 uncharacterized protein Dana_GF18797, isoform B [Drosophila ananassae]